MRLRAKNEFYTPAGKDVTRGNTDEVIRQYDGLISKYNADASAWRKVGFISIGLFAACVICLIYTINLPKTELVVVGVNDIGQTRYYGKTGGISYDGYDMKESIIKNIVNEFIKGTYTITADPEYMYNNYSDCMFYLDENKRRYYEMEIQQTDPFSHVGEYKQNVKIESVIPTSSSTYQVDFFLITSDMAGYGLKEKRMRGILSFRKLTAEQYNKTNETLRIKNPMGIYITDYSITEIGDVTK